MHTSIRQFTCDPGAAASAMRSAQTRAGGGGVGGGVGQRHADA